jgi:hypothetical protein
MIIPIIFLILLIEFSFAEKINEEKKNEQDLTFNYKEKHNLEDSSSKLTKRGQIKQSRTRYSI